MLQCDISHNMKELCGEIWKDYENNQIGFNICFKAFDQMIAMAVLVLIGR